MSARVAESGVRAHVTGGEAWPVRDSGGAPRSGLVRAAVGPILVSFLGLASILTVMLSWHGFNPTGLIHIGDWLRAERFWGHGVILEQGLSGYDGQYFFYLAHDPLLRDAEPGAFLDHPAYRYARILYPLLVWIVTLGRPEAIPWAMLLLNLAAALVGTAAAVDVLRSVGANRWLAIVFAFSPSIVVGVTANLSEPTALALVAVGLALALRRRVGWAGLAFGIAALGREVYAVVPLVFACHALWRRSWREAALYTAPLGIPFIWHLWVWARFGLFSSLGGPGAFGAPLLGPWYRITVLTGISPPLRGEPAFVEPGSFAALQELLLVGLALAVMLLGLAKLGRRRDIFAWQLGAQSALALFTSPLVWVGMTSYMRVLGLLVLCYGLVLVTAPRGGRRVSGLPRSE